MTYDAEYWDSYADKNESCYNGPFAEFVSGLASSLRCASVLEVGCGTGIDLRKFPDAMRVVGVDLNDRALAIAKEKMPSAEFKKGDIARLPLGDSSIDMVFTHQLLNYLDEHALEKGMREMYRVASLYILNCEKYGEAEGDIDSRHRYRNMRRRWAGYDARIVSDVDMHEEIEPDRVRFTLVKKGRPRT